MIRLAIMASKGGTGKTTTAINLGHGLAMAGKRVLIVDCDPQGSASSAFGINSHAGLVDLMLGNNVDIYKVRPNLYLLPSGKRKLAELEIKLASSRNRSTALSEALSRLTGCDCVILDCSPSINIINLNALEFAAHLLIPSSLDFFSLEGVKTTIELGSELGEGDRNGIDILGILPTFYDRRTVVSRLALESLRGEYGGSVFRTEIRMNAQIKKSQWHKKTIFEYAPYSFGAYDYFNLSNEVMERLRDN